MHIYNHITLTADRESPTSSLTQGDMQGLNMLKMICMEDYGTRAGINVPFVGHCIVIAPDYEGYGLTKNRVHPYMVQELMGRQVTDAAIYGLALYRKELKNSLTTGWQPKHRIAFLHSKADMVVPYSNYLAFRDAHAADEGRLFKVWDDTLSTADHVDGGFTFFVSIGMTHALAQQFQWLSE